MIAWKQLSGPVHYRTEDRMYQVHEVHSPEGMRFRAVMIGCLKAAPLGPLRDTAEACKADAEAHAAKLREAA